MFKNTILNRFLMRRFFMGVGLVLLVICSIIFSVTFVERIPMNPDAYATMIDSWVRLLEYFPMFLPMTVFMGTLLAYYGLTKSSEGIIVSSAGISPFQSARPFLFGAAFIGIFVTTVINPYSVRLSSENITADKLKLVDDSIWLRETSGNGYITMNAKDVHVTDNAITFKETTVFYQSTDFKLIERIQTDELVLTDSGMDAKNAKIWNKDGKQRTGNWHIDTLLTPKNVLDRYLQPNQISFFELQSFIKKMDAIGAPTVGYRVQFWSLLFLPLTMVSLATLGIAFSQTRQRRNYSFIFKFGIGIITCFALYFLLNMFNALGANGSLPALLSVIAPPLIIISASGLFISSFDII